MSKEEIQPVVGPDGKVLPGLFAFDTLETDPQIEKDIQTFVKQEKLREIIQKIESEAV